MDVEFIGPHRSAVDGSVDPADGVLRPQATPEGIAVRGKTLVVTIQKIGDDAQHLHLFRVVGIDHPLLAGAHFIDNLFFRETKTLAIHQA